MARARAFRPRRFRFEWLLLTAALLVLGGSIGLSLALQYQRVEQEESDRLRAAAQVLGEMIGQRLAGAERALRTLDRDLAPSNGPAHAALTLTLPLNAIASALDGIRVVRVLDARGRVSGSSRAEPLGKDFSAREAFNSARQRREPAMVLTASPAPAMPGGQVFELSRAIPDGRGGFAGVVVAELDADYFSVLVDSLRYAPDVSVSVADARGRVLLLVPPSPGDAGRRLDGTAAAFAHHRASGQVATLMRGVSASLAEASGDDVVLAMQTVRHAGGGLDEDLVVGVARRQSLMHVNWRLEAAVESGLLLVVVLSSVFGLNVVQGRQRRIDAIAAERSAEQRAAAERLRLAADAAGLGVWEYDPVGRRLTWDASMYALYGSAEEETVSEYEDWRKHVLPDDLALAEAAFQASIGDRAQFRMDFRIRRGDGAIRMISALGRPFCAAEGAPLRVIGTNQDVTERWQVDAAVHASEARLKAVFDVLPVGISVTDAAGMIVDCNAASERLLGISREAHFGRGYAACFGRMRRPDGSRMDSDEEPARRALNSGVAVFDVEMIVETPDGERWLSVSAVPVGSPAPVRGRREDAVGVAGPEEARGVVIAYVDVGAARRSETELRKLSRAVEQSAAAVLVTDVDGAIEYVNPAACEAYGYSAADLLGASPRVFASGLTPLETYQSLWSTILAGRVWRGELENRRRDGRLIHQAVSISPVRDRGGLITHFVAITEDVSARVEAERMKDDLKTRLSRVERMEVMGAMAGGVAHDFNNILVAILGFSGLGKTVLRAAGGPERVVSYFEEIEIAGERARALVQQLLVFSRGGSLKVDTIDLPDVAHEVVTLVASSFPACVTLSARMADDLPALEMDRSHLHRLLVNLCVNARDAMDGPGSVVISARPVHVEEAQICASCHAEFSGEFLRIAVVDQGHGIPEAIRNRIFEPFFTTKDVGSGSGMGLAVVHGVSHLYDGHLQIVAAPDGGTELVVLLPRRVWHVDAPLAGAAQPASGLPPASASQPRTTR